MDLSNIDTALQALRAHVVVYLDGEGATEALDQLLTAFAALDHQARADARAAIRRAFAELGRESLIRGGMPRAPFGVWRLDQAHRRLHIEYPARFDPDNFTIEAMDAFLEDEREGDWWRDSDRLQYSYLALARGRGLREFSFAEGLKADLELAYNVDFDEPSAETLPEGITSPTEFPFEHAPRDDRGFLPFEAAITPAPRGFATLIDDVHPGGDDPELLDVIAWGRMGLERYHFMRREGVYLDVYSLSYRPAFSLEVLTGRIAP